MEFPVENECSDYSFGRFVIFVWVGVSYSGIPTARYKEFVEYSQR